MKMKRALIGLASILVFSGAMKGVLSISDYYAQFPDEIIKITAKEDPENFDEEQVEDYPKTYEFNYHIPIDSPLIEEDVVYALKGSDSEYWTPTVLRETKDGYISEFGDDTGFLVEDMKDFGFKGYIEADEPNGTMEVTFPNNEAHVDFMNEITSNGTWKETFLYMKEYEK